jgi:hypothetical protein
MNLRKRPCNVRVKHPGAGLGPTYVTSSSGSDGAIGEIYFMGNPASFVPSSSNLSPLRYTLGDRVSTTLALNSGASFPYVLLQGNDVEGIMYAKTKIFPYTIAIGRNNAVTRANDNRTCSRVTGDKGVTWTGNFFHRPTKPLFENSTSMILLNNKGYPTMEHIQERFSMSSVPVTVSGGTYTNGRKILYSGWNLESDGTTIEVYPFLTPSYVFGNQIRHDDNLKNILAPLKNDFVVTLTGSEVTQFANTSSFSAMNVYAQPIQMSENFVDSTSNADTLIVTLFKPLKITGQSFPTLTIDDVFWYKTTNGGTSWTDISSNIRTAVNALVIPSSVTNKIQVAPQSFLWSKDDNLWYGVSNALAYWTSPDLNTWTVVQDPAGTWPQYPN